MRAKRILFLVIIFSILNVHFVFAFETYFSADLNLELTSQNFRKREITVTGKISFLKMDSEQLEKLNIEALKIKIDTPWGLKKISGKDELIIHNPKSRTYQLIAKYKVASEPYKAIPIILTGWVKVNNEWYPLVSLDSKTSAKVYLKVAESGKLLCGLRRGIFSSFNNKGLTPEERKAEIEEIKKTPCDFKIPLESAKRTKSKKSESIIIDLPDQEFGFNFQIPQNWTVLKAEKILFLGPKRKNYPLQPFPSSLKVETLKWCLPESYDPNIHGLPIDFVAELIFNKDFRKEGNIPLPNLYPQSIADTLYPPALYIPINTSTIGETVLFARRLPTNEWEVYQFSLIDPNANKEIEKIFFNILKSLRLYKPELKPCEGSIQFFLIF